MHQKTLSFVRTNLKYIVIALICSLILLFYIGFDQVALSTDDDVQLNLIASGALGPHSQYLIYINIVYGWLLKLLFLAVPSVNWYLFCGLFFNLCAVIAICWLLCRNLRLLPSVSVTLLCMLFFSKDFFLSTQFTSNVYIYVVAGYFWLLYAIKHDSKSAFFFASFFVVLSSMARAAAFFMTVPFLVVILLVHLAYHREWIKDKKTLFRKLAPVAALLVVTVLLIGLDTYAYDRNEDWAYFQKRLEALTVIEDRGSLDYLNHVELYDEAGFPMSAINMITNWLDNDTEVYSLERLQKMCDIKNSYDNISFRLEWNLLERSVHSIFSRIFLGQQWLPWLYAGTALSWILLNDKKRLWIVASLSALVFSLYYALCCYGRLGWHVEIGIWLLALLLPFADRLTDEPAMSFSPEHDRCGKPLHIVFALLLIVPALFCAVSVVRNPQGSRLVDAPNTVTEAEKTHEVLEHLRANKNNFYVVASPLGRGCWGASSVYDLNYTHSSDFENICWLGGWFSGSPLGLYHAHEAGISNPVRALFERKNTFLVSTESEAEWMIYFLWENYRQDITYRSVGEVAGYGIWQFYIS